MKATSNSKKSIKILKRIETIVSPALMANPRVAVIKISEDNDKIIVCPANMFANKRIIKANGFINIPKNSMMGSMGNGGAFIHIGTSGHTISFQYSRLPNTLIATNEQNANTKVTEIFPVTFAPPGKMGTNPIILFSNMKKKIVNKKGANFR